HAAPHHRHRDREGERGGGRRQDRGVPRHGERHVRPRGDLKATMSEPIAGGRMTALDAAFYNLERTGQLLHVAGVYTVEGALDFDRLRADLAARMHLIPRYTERAVPVPLNLAHPTWEPDPHFDIRHHVLRHTLRAQGGAPGAPACARAPARCATRRPSCASSAPPARRSASSPASCFRTCPRRRSTAT